MPKLTRWQKHKKEYAGRNMTNKEISAAYRRKLDTLNDEESKPGVEFNQHLFTLQDMYDATEGVSAQDAFPATPTPTHEMGNIGQLVYGGNIGDIKVDLTKYSVDQLHALSPYGSMLSRMSSTQITQLLDKTSSVTPDGRPLFASRPPPKRNFLPAQRRFVVTPGGDRMYI